MDRSKKIAVIGAGPAGLSAAYCLVKEGYKVDVYEADSQVGGMCKTIDLWNWKVDIGPHRFFSSDRVVNELWLEVAGKDYEMVSRLTRIYYRSKFYLYPLKPLNAFFNLGPFETLRCLLSYFKQRINPVPLKDDFESWVTRRFGNRLFSIFFKNYSEKLWGVQCTELDSDFATQRIKKLSLYEAVKNAFLGGGGHKTLVDEFAYPLEGTGMIYERMAEKIVRGGGNLYLSSPVKKIIVENGITKGLLNHSSEIIEYDTVISTMPLTLLVNSMDETPEEIRRKAGELKFRNTIVVYLNINGKDLFEDNWLYIHSPDIKTGRITNFRNWVPELYRGQDNTIIALEYWCNDDDTMWRADEMAIITMAREDMIKTKLLASATILDGKVIKVPRCYPVYKKGYKELLRPVEEYLKTIAGLFPIGRYGAFKYNNQDHSILMGILASENIINDKKNDLWQVNTDYENYQENTVITKTGLKIKN